VIEEARISIEILCKSIFTSFNALVSNKFSSVHADKSAKNSSRFLTKLAESEKGKSG